MLKRFLFVIVIAISGTASGVEAQDTQIQRDPTFETFLQSSGYRTYIDKVFNAMEPAESKAQCAVMRSTQLNQYVPLQTVTFAGPESEKTLTAGAWVAVIHFDRCGKQVIRRAVLHVQPNGSLSPIRLLPGDFRGSLQLEADALHIISPGLLVAGHCNDAKKLVFLDVERHGEGADKWSETWTAEVCDVVVHMDVNYVTVNGEIVISGNVKK